MIEELQELREELTDLFEGQAYQQTEIDHLRLTFDQQSDEFQDDLNPQEDEFTDLLEREIQQLQNENKNLSDQLSTNFQTFYEELEQKEDSFNSLLQDQAEQQQDDKKTLIGKLADQYDKIAEKVDDKIKFHPTSS